MKAIFILLLLLLNTYLYGKSFVFFGQNMVVNNELSSKTDSITLNQIGLSLFEVSKQLQLDEIGYMLLCKTYIQQFNLTQNQKEKSLFEILKSQNYDVLLTMSGKNLLCFGKINIAFKNSIYIISNKKRYDLLDFKQNKLFGNHKILRFNNQKYIRTLTLIPHQKPKFKGNKSQKMSFNFKNDTQTFDFVGNPNLIAYYNELPNLPLETCIAQVPFSDTLIKTLINPIKNNIKNLSKLAKIEYILQFVQNINPYKTDEEIYGKEHYSLAEETLLQPYSDCEDKTILMAALCKQILNINALGLYYKDKQHINLALELNDVKTAYSFTREGKNYLICEPTGIGYHIGDKPYPVEQIHTFYKL